MVQLEIVDMRSSRAADLPSEAQKHTVDGTRTGGYWKLKSLAWHLLHPRQGRRCAFRALFGLVPIFRSQRVGRRPGTADLSLEPTGKVFSLLQAYPPSRSLYPLKKTTFCPEHPRRRLNARARSHRVHDAGGRASRFRQRRGGRGECPQGAAEAEARGAAGGGGAGV